MVNKDTGTASVTRWNMPGRGVSCCCERLIIEPFPGGLGTPLLLRDDKNDVSWCRI